MVSSPNTSPNDPSLAAGEKLRVLAVDDDPGVRSLLQFGLTDLGYLVDVAECVPEALACLRRRSYSLVLSDYDMPGGSGMDLLAYVAEVYPDVPFIMLTGHGETPLAQSAIRSGALDFLTKPFRMQQLARLIAQNLARWERDRAQAEQMAQEVLSGTIHALVAAVDAKDPHTAHHSERVTRIALRLGEAVGLPERRLRVLEFAALLHDVGKIGVPETVLLKPGSLDEAEWALMKAHPVRSAQIVGRVAQLTEVASIVRHHHERVDGRGYPDGISGEAIPYLSRIITLADAYEAMTADRSYRRARTPEEARQIIQSDLGRHFDPDLGQVFLSLRDLP